MPSTNLHYRSRRRRQELDQLPRRRARTPTPSPSIPRTPRSSTPAAAARAGTCRASHDGGKTWKPAGRGLRDAASTASSSSTPSDPATVYAVTGFHDLFKSDDGGATFTRLALPAEGTDEVCGLATRPRLPARCCGRRPRPASCAATTAAATGALRARHRPLPGAGRGLRSRDSRHHARRLRRRRRLPQRRRRRHLVAVAPGPRRRVDRRAVRSRRRLRRALFAQTSVGVWRREPARPGASCSARSRRRRRQARRRDLRPAGAAGGVGLHHRAAGARPTAAGRWERAQGQGALAARHDEGRPRRRRSSAAWRSDPGRPEGLYAGSWSNDGPGQRASSRPPTAARPGSPPARAAGGSGDPPAQRGGGRRLRPGRDRSMFRSRRRRRQLGRRSAPACPDGEIRELAIDPAAPRASSRPPSTASSAATDGADSWRRVGERAARGRRRGGGRRPRRRRLRRRLPRRLPQPRRRQHLGADERRAAQPRRARAGHRGRPLSTPAPPAAASGRRRCRGAERRSPTPPARDGTDLRVLDAGLGGLLFGQQRTRGKRPAGSSHEPPRAALYSLPRAGRTRSAERDDPTCSRPDG